MIGVTLLVGASACKENEKFYANVQKSDVFVQKYDTDKYDFLWVMDNSPTMGPKRAYVRDNIAGFLEILNSRKAIDFNMAFTDTDMFNTEGHLIESPTGQRVVSSTTSSNIPGEIAAIINSYNQSSVTSFWEQGLESAFQAVAQHGTEFSRKKVPLAVIFLTDGPDYSCKDNCLGVEPENNPDWIPYEFSRYTEFFSHLKAVENSDIYIFPLVGLNVNDCSMEGTGDQYINLAQFIGGLSVSGSLCSQHLSESFNTIAQLIADRGNKFPLSYKASGVGIQLYIDQQPVEFSPENYIYDEESNSIIFKGVAPKNGQIIEVSYQQATN